MVFHEVQQLAIYPFKAFLYRVNFCSVAGAVDNGTQCIVKQDFVIEEIKLAKLEIIPVFGWIVYLGDKDDVWVDFFNLRNNPGPEVNRDHFSHIASESIDALICPE